MDLVERLRQRDEQALRLLQEHYGGYCYCIINNLLQNPQETEEALSDVWLQVWNSIPPASPTNLKAYLAKAARNTALNYIKHNSAAARSAVTLLLEELADCLPDQSAEDSLNAGALREALNRFLQTLSREERTLFVRRYWYGDTVPQLARAFHGTESRITSTLYRLRKRLKSHMEQEGFGL